MTAELGSGTQLGLEVSDLIVSYDPQTLERRPVLRSEVVEYFAERGNRAALRIVESIPSRDDVIDPEAVDGILVRAHMELQRLHEEFMHGPRVLELLRPMLEALRRAGVPPPWRVVDIGCGLGYTVRWLTSRAGLGPDVHFIGVDYNARLVHCAQRTGELEGLRCDFRVGNAFSLDEPATIYLSTGAVHHFRDADLLQFFSSQSQAQGFLHFDILPTWLTTFGAWLFHRARMRSALARHDGVLSARRAHPGPALLAAAREGAPQLALGLFDGSPGHIPVTHVFQCVVGLRQPARAEFRSLLGDEIGRLSGEQEDEGTP